MKLLTPFSPADPTERTIKHTLSLTHTLFWETPLYLCLFLSAFLLPDWFSTFPPLQHRSPPPSDPICFQPGVTFTLQTPRSDLTFHKHIFEFVAELESYMLCILQNLRRKQSMVSQVRQVYWHTNTHLTVPRGLPQIVQHVDTGNHFDWYPPWLLLTATVAVLEASLQLSATCVFVSACLNFHWFIFENNLC